MPTYVNSPAAYPQSSQSSPYAVAALDIGGTKIAAAIVRYDTAGVAPAVMLSRSVPTEAKRGGEAVLKTATETLLLLLRDARAQGLRPHGVGVSTAGRVDAMNGSIAFANEIMPGWTGQPIADVLHKASGLPVAVVNDVQAHALGEARWGAAKDAQTCLVIAAGTGVGGAVIAQGKLLRGKHGFAGEVGHISSSLAHGIPCVCGGSGHLELVASGSGIEARYAEAARLPEGETLSGAEISLKANQGDATAKRVIVRAGMALGEAIADLTNVLDPEIVVVSGSVIKAGTLWRQALQQGFERQIPEAQRDLPIVYARLGANAPLIGAAEELLDKLSSR